LSDAGNQIVHSYRTSSIGKVSQQDLEQLSVRE